METVENLVKTTLGEIEKLLSTRTVVGEPIAIEGVTLIPLITIAFGFGAGGGSGREDDKRKGEGTAGGTGGGATVMVTAVIIIDKQGVRIEPVKGAITSTIEKLGEIIPQTIERGVEKVAEKWAERK